MDKFKIKNHSIKDYLVNTGASSGTIDYSITKMFKTPQTAKLTSYGYNDTQDTNDYLTTATNMSILDSHRSILRHIYNLYDYADKTLIPYLPIDASSNTAYLAIRPYNYSYGNMTQIYISEQSTSNKELFTIFTSEKDNNLYLYTSTNSSKGIKLKSPVIYIILQAGGGNGGRGAHNDPIFGYQSASGGGAGGSGASAFIRVNAAALTSNNKLFIKTFNDGQGGLSLRAYLGSFYPTTTENFSTASHTLLLKGGRHGSSGSAGHETATGGNGGSAGDATLKGVFNNANSTVMFTVSVNGTAGSAGSTAINSSGVVQQKNGGNTQRSNQFALDASFPINTRMMRTDGTIIDRQYGYGEEVASKTNAEGKDIKVGGVGGAPSPLGPGMSHKTNTQGVDISLDYIWPGAGGVGQAGYNGCGGANLEPFNYGGPAAAWLFYLEDKDELTTYEDILNFTKRSDGNYDVALNKNLAHPSLIEIPSQYNGKSVVGIINEGFSGDTSLREIVLPDSITSIGDYAFKNCYNLTNIYYGKAYSTSNSPSFTYTTSKNAYFHDANLFYRSLEHKNVDDSWYYNNNGYPATHEYIIQETSPTCTDDGKITYDCKICGHHKSETLDALGHDWDNFYEYETYRYRYCHRCGRDDYEALVAIYFDGGLAYTGWMSFYGTATITYTFTKLVADSNVVGKSDNCDASVSHSGYDVTLTINHTAGDFEPILINLEILLHA